MGMKVCKAAVAAVLALMNSVAGAEGAPADLQSAIAGGKVNLDLRLRYESVDQNNALDDADALTLRTRLGYVTAPWRALVAFAEMENTSALIDDYAPATAGHSVVADPEGSEVNQYGLRYTGLPGLAATLGRSKLILDNARWVGNVGWRQNEQTFDGAFLKYSGLAALTGQYAYLSNVNTITATNADLDGHLVNLAWAALPQLTLTAYAYLLDYEAPATTDVDTIGLRASGSAGLGQAVKLIYAAEYAQQDAETLVDDFSADYLLAELGFGFKPLTITLGYEVLGSDDGLYGLQTPLATKHAFQGWADVFLVTPATGIEDLYVAAQGSVGPVKLAAAYHEFSADESTPAEDYGSEIDVSAGMKMAGKLNGLIKYASYSADDFGVDTDKLWAQLEYQF